MASSRKRSQEEKNLRTLRELAALPANKQCFDCHQRGPTYINMTVGSFVCTSCSGILRGLNPPHRVKSITMTVFTPDEIEFVKARGNEYCRHVWMGTHDSSHSMEPEARDEQKVKDFMSQKYEKKRWYVDPEVAMARKSQQNSVPPTPEPETKPLSTLLGRSPTPLVVHHNNTPSASSPAQPPPSWPSVVAPVPHQQASKAMDLLSEFGGDPFGVAPPPPKIHSPASATTTSANGNFANFESAFNESARPTSLPFTRGTQAFSSPLSLPAFLSRPQREVPRKAFTPPAGWASFEDDTRPPAPPFAPPTKEEGPSQPPFFLATPTENTPVNSPPAFYPPSADRYAALADLDTLFHQGPATSTSTAAPQPTPAATSWPAATQPHSNSSFASQPVSVFGSAPSSNPFSGGGTTTTWSTQQQQPLFAANPFQAHFPGPLDNFPATGFGPFAAGPPNGAVLPSAFGIQQNGNVGFSWPAHMVHSGWVQQQQQQGPPHFQTSKIAANPFMGSAVLAVPRGNSSNPFL